MKRRAQTSFMSVATLALLLGCGGNVNLGGKGTDGDSNPDRDPPTTTEPDPSASTSLVKLPEVNLDDLVVAGDHLYFTAYGAKQTQGLYRCDQARCKATLKLLAEGGFAFPQVLGNRLGVSRFSEPGGSYDLMTFALPDASAPQVVFGDLPGLQPSPALFTNDFVYFGVLMDHAVYRCAQPDCAAGPQQLAPNPGVNHVKLEADAGLLFWTDGSFIYRAGDDGVAPVEILQPDGQLSAAPPRTFDPEYPVDGVDSLAVRDGMLYASVARSQTGRGCDSTCPHEIVGWPVEGGPIQVFFKSNTRLSNVAIVDGELMWFRPSTPFSDAATMSTCRVEACEATYRELGQVKSEDGVFTAGEQHVYWVEAKAEQRGNTSFLADEIRRSPRLPKP